MLLLWMVLWCFRGNSDFTYARIWVLDEGKVPNCCIVPLLNSVLEVSDILESSSYPHDVRLV